MKRFESSRLILRAWTKYDLNDLHEIMSNKKVADLAGFRVRANISEINEILKKFIQEPYNSLWAIELKEINKVVGWIELHEPMDNVCAGSKEIGFVLSELFWGRGVAMEAIKQIVTYAFMEEQACCIVCSHFENNIQSKKVIEKSGFKYKLKYNDKFYYCLENVLNLRE
ncbi:MAG: GNAT family N-acetyltransferase [Clostridiaceae bacterium]